MDIVQFNGVLSSCESEANIFILYFSTSYIFLLRNSCQRGSTRSSMKSSVAFPFPSIWKRRNLRTRIWDPQRTCTFSMSSSYCMYPRFLSLSICEKNVLDLRNSCLEGLEVAERGEKGGRGGGGEEGFPAVSLTPIIDD